MKYLKNLKNDTKGLLIISASIFMFLIFFTFSYWSYGGSFERSYDHKRWGIISWILDKNTKSIGGMPLKYHWVFCLATTAFGTSLVIVAKSENNLRNIDQC